MANALPVPERGRALAIFSTWPAPSPRLARSPAAPGRGGEASLAEQARPHAQAILGAIQHDFALASGTVFYAMAGVMALAFLVALKWMPPGKAPDLEDVGEPTAPLGER